MGRCCSALATEGERYVDSFVPKVELPVRCIGGEYTDPDLGSTEEEEEEEEKEEEEGKGREGKGREGKGREG
jgi:hypothetical protein